jgi:2-polyprenyl-6-methoxyphenol hydroxylase-like FAD-dependent oxidoreductase
MGRIPCFAHLSERDRSNGCQDDDVTQVLVVGGGIAGLALAGRLARQGVGVEIVERSPAWDRGTGIYLPGNALRALGDLGVADQVRESGRVNRRRRYLTASGRTLFEIDVDRYWGEVGPALGAHRHNLHRALLGAAKEVPIHLGTTVTDLDDEGGKLTVTLGDGHRKTCDLVVGADGVHSAVRRLAFGGGAERGASLGSVSWRSVIANVIDVDCWTVWTGPKSLLLTVPIDDESIYVFASRSAGETIGGAPSVGQLASAFEGFASPVTQVVDAMTGSPADIHLSPIEEVDQDVWHRDRVVLIGDAAHAMAPTMAQGAALAMEDALVLSELMTSEPDPAAVGSQFEERRRPRVEWVRAHTERQARLLNLPYPLRNLAASIAGGRLWRRSFSLLRDPY